MKKLLTFLLIVSMLAIAFSAVNGQKRTSTESTGNPPNTITPASSPVELAKAALAAHGGAKFTGMKSMVLTGSADLFAPNSTQAVPGTFALVVAGERQRLEINALPVVAFKQIFDGQRGYSSLDSLQCRYSLPLLGSFDRPGYTVSALADKKKLRAFRIVDAAGNTTDFYIDPTTGRVKTFLTNYNGFTCDTENTTLKEFEGVFIPVEFSQRLDTTQGTFFANFKVRDVKLNQAVSEELFVFP
jgi:hypothetical protein